MRFDYTHGNEAKYMVSLYGWNVQDYYYYASYKDAKEAFKNIQSEGHKDVALSLWDLKKDVRKEYVKF